MNTQPFISICIPAYKNLLFLERLLNSIEVQTFRDFEVLITDDSPDDELKNFTSNFQANFSIQYFKNKVSLGTPENWNEGIRKATGKWIKIMHDDDWFVNEKSLEIFANAALQNSSKFIFSAFCNIYLDENRNEQVLVNSNSFRFLQLKNNAASLLSKNIIGPPSVTMHLNDGNIFYDNKFKWLVDIDFYARIITSSNVVYIKEILINVGLSNEQVTQSCFRIANVEIPEYFYFMNKIGYHNLKNIFVYDASWRLIRNLEIRNLNHIRNAEYLGEVNTDIYAIVKFQSRFSVNILKIGFISKLMMLIHYFYYRLK